MDEGLKIRGIKYLNVETRWLFPPPITISGYTPDPISNFSAKVSVIIGHVSKRKVICDDLLF